MTVPHFPGVVLLDYTNHRGERSTRRVVPQRLYLGRSPWHPGEQWLLECWDLDKGADRTFLMENVHGWRAER